MTALTLYKRTLILALLLLCGAAVYGQTHYVMIETNMGNMKVMLYDDTPLDIHLPQKSA